MGWLYPNIATLEVGRLLMSLDSTPAICWAKELRAVCNLLFASDFFLIPINFYGFLMVFASQRCKSSSIVVPVLDYVCSLFTHVFNQYELWVLELYWSYWEGLVSFLRMLNATYHIIRHGPPQLSNKKDVWIVEGEQMQHGATSKDVDCGFPYRHMLWVCTLRQQGIAG